MQPPNHAGPESDPPAKAEFESLSSQGLDINPKFKKAYQLMENTEEHVFITGRAGTGKSTLLNYFKENTEKSCVLLAPTGIAAINIGGQTIHSFFGFPPYPLHSDHIGKRRNRKLYQNLDCIIIDEISMVRADLLDGIDYFLRLNGKYNDRPFGGVQMIFVGDLFQLPPVISTDVERQMFEFLYETPFFFSANVLYSLELNYIELNTVYRQADSSFLGLLDQIRTGEIDEYTLENINVQHKLNFQPPEDQFYITLATTNKIARRINDYQLAKLNTPVEIYDGKITGDFEAREFPTDQNLALKEGAQVMFLKNDPHLRWANGTLGKIKYLDDDGVTVELQRPDGEIKVHTIEKSQWEIVKYEYDEGAKKITAKIMGTFKQYPLKLAWAVTIHKSQGKTFDNIIVDIGRGAFAPGQIYVALSRCTTLEGIALRQKIQYSDIIVDPRIINFAHQTGIYKH